MQDICEVVVCHFANFHSDKQTRNSGSNLSSASYCTEVEAAPENLGVQPAFSKAADLGSAVQTGSTSRGEVL